MSQQRGLRRSLVIRRKTRSIQHHRNQKSASKEIVLNKWAQGGTYILALMLYLHLHSILGLLAQSPPTPNSNFHTSDCFKYSPNKHIFSHLKPACWRRKWQLTPVFLPGESHGQRSLAGCSPWDHKESVGHDWETKTYTDLLTTHMQQYPW